MFVPCPLSSQDYGATELDALDAVLLITQPVLCSHIASAKRGIIHVIIKPLARISASNDTVL